MKRRGFLGFIGGAAVAGPSVAKNTIVQMPSGLGLARGAIGGGYGNSVPSAPSGDWRIDEIARLKRIITGDLSEEEKEAARADIIRSKEAIISQHAASLVSVAAVAKIAIFNREARRLHREIDVMNSGLYLKRLLREMGQ